MVICNDPQLAAKEIFFYKQSSGERQEEKTADPDRLNKFAGIERHAIEPDFVMDMRAGGGPGIT